MRAVIKGVIAATLLAGSSLAATAPVQAHDRTGTALLAGVIGLGVGAAIASSSNHYDNRDAYYGNGYSSGGYYAQTPVYYGSGYGYNNGYGYTGGYGRDYGRGYGRGYRDHDRHDRDGRDGGRDYRHHDRDGDGWDRR